MKSKELKEKLQNAILDLCNCTDYIMELTFGLEPEHNIINMFEHNNNIFSTVERNMYKVTDKNKELQSVNYILFIYDVETDTLYGEDPKYDIGWTFLESDKCNASDDLVKKFLNS